VSRDAALKRSWSLAFGSQAETLRLADDIAGRRGGSQRARQLDVQLLAVALEFGGEQILGVGLTLEAGGDVALKHAQRLAPAGGKRAELVDGGQRARLAGRLAGRTFNGVHDTFVEFALTLDYLANH
jgi:hypothetical protein